MTTVLLRRKGLGRTSCKEIANYCNSDVVVVRNDIGDWPDHVDLVIRWGCTANSPTKHILNKAEAIHLVSNKSGFRKLLRDKAPHTIPATWFNEDYNTTPITFPLVVRPQLHSQGKQLWVVADATELEKAIQKAGEGWYASELINKVAEYRVCFVQGRVAWVANKIPGNPDDVAWNVAQGGKFTNVNWGDWPLKSIRIAREAFMLSGLDFGGVDVMRDAENNVYVLEINSAPSLTSPYRQQCMARCFDYVIEHNVKDVLPVIDEKGGWRKFIHPALSEEAQLV